MTPRLLALAYHLRTCYWGDWPLATWTVVGPLIAAGVLLMQWLVRGRPALAFWHWLGLGGLCALAAGMLVLKVWAERRGYIIFTPTPDATEPNGLRMPPTDKHLHHVTGRLEVEGKSHFFANLPAYWRTFASGEHAVMAIARPTHCLGVGQLPERDVGMWYIFFQPHELTAITPGRLAFGSAIRPALRVDYRNVPTAPLQRNRPPPRHPIPQTLYMAFDDEAARQPVWADLLADRAGEGVAGR